MSPARGSDEWFARRTYRALDHHPYEVAARKMESELTVSVVIPARNEAATIADVVSMVASLPEHVVDELVVMDGGSEDATAERAAAAGARVHRDTAILAEHQPSLGKGDALWRSLAVTSGQVVVFVDADLHKPDPALVWGLLVPFLAEPEVQLVKAFYERSVGDRGSAEEGGGRVTELLARPLLNLFWPELAAVVQPLAGEYAGRRSLLEQLPFFTGYGVEFGLLVDTFAHAGPEALAQVDVGERIHHHQPLPDLSRMAATIAQVAMHRLAAEGRIDPTTLFRDGEIPRSLTQFVRDSDDRVESVHHDVGVRERPPIAQVLDSLA
ncbi:glucosyl-3-phosphoglycerate synthase [Egibacter rhizosphaerae]|uniref:Glucosyl-3-phosphoglycerate synthase n=1 Tax=Egibacter rhizosphaerae TaxID=1670831 RepID=A0A411YAR0_9ACTN|nr:glucosyl-3-phosphoglycerate synthase [Egibacter rhizosphaerae]QBI18294.1 glucosyl-3-phosphoglycerate synthase [Egibacter rhizosphaerae]